MPATGNEHRIARWAVAQPHPAVLLLLWINLTLVMQSLQLPFLLILGSPLLIIAAKVSATKLMIMLRRMRWLILFLLLVYGYATPGEPVWPGGGMFSPTQQGLQDCLVQGCRLVFALAGLSILLHSLSRLQLLAGLYTLAYPLRCLGLSRERVAMRLALTVQYSESGLFKTNQWRDSIEGALQPVTVNESCIELPVAAFALVDGVWLMAGAALPIVALVLQARL